MSDPNDPSRRLEAALERLGAEHAPPAGWEARVLAAIDRAERERAMASASTDGEPREVRRTREIAAPVGPSVEPAQLIDLAARRRARWGSSQVVVAVGTLAAISLLVVGMFRRESPPKAPPLEIDVAVQSVGEPRRAAPGSAHLGDVWSATARGGAGYRELWAYRDDQLILRCPPVCQTSGDSLVAMIPLTLPGSYVVLAVSSAEPIPVPQGSYDADVAAAEQAGAQYKPRRLDIR